MKVHADNVKVHAVTGKLPDITVNVRADAAGSAGPTAPLCSPRPGIDWAAPAHLGGRHPFVLRSVGDERRLSSLDAEDAYLSNLAAKLSRQIGHAADGIERELAGLP